ncbi:MAG: DNA-processing protein DprA, partial [Myxococcota bacterium]
MRLKSPASTLHIPPRFENHSKNEVVLTDIGGFTHPEQMSIEVLLRTDAAYPRRFHELGDAPAKAYLKGTLPAGPTVAIVGARRASEAGRNMARGLAEALTGAGFEVISGGAIGIDAAAHEGALAAGGRTFAVLGSSLFEPGPKLNLHLLERIIKQGGGWLSEQAGRPDRLAFCRRNRLIAALADQVIVVEGTAKSGTSYTLKAARRLGRRIMAVTWAPGDPRGGQSEWVFANGGE